jgi:glycosyltransferase involved in cell wall biosynthesis
MLADANDVQAKKMKIAYLIPSCGISGGVAVICQHANRLLARGNHVVLLAETIDNGLDWFPNQKVPVLSLKQYPKDIDILVATGWSTSFLVANLPAKHKFYFVQSDETRFHPKDSKWEHITRLSYLMSFNYLTEARWIKSWLLANFGHGAQLIPNGLDPDLFHPTDPLQPKTQKPRILLEGAIDLPYKGMAEAFEAVSDLDVEVWCVSSYGRPKREWKCDRFFEQVPITEMARIYSSCDILLKLSRVEGFFGPPMEMMACGGAVIVGRVTGYDEYIVDGENALVVEPNDVPAARAAVQKLIFDHELRNRLIENGKKTAAAWSWDKSMDDLENYYREVLEGKAGISVTDVRIATNKSIAFFFYQLLGIELQDSQDSPLPSLHVGMHNYAHRLSLRLEKLVAYRLIANLLGRAYYHYKKTVNRINIAKLRTSK